MNIDVMYEVIHRQGKIPSRTMAQWISQITSTIFDKDRRNGIRHSLSDLTAELEPDMYIYKQQTTREKLDRLSKNYLNSLGATQ